VVVVFIKYKIENLPKSRQ